MKYVDEYRDEAKAKSLTSEILRMALEIGSKRTTPLRIMEVCGGHTHAIFRYGIEGLLPQEIELVHGPGCPVCVLPVERVNACVALAEMEGVILATFGDAMRAPGSDKSLLQARAEGSDVRMVYSPLDALKLARDNPDKEVVFFGLGFETTTPSVALTVLRAESEGLRNFSVFCNHITIIPTLQALLESPDHRLDGFIGPGHVSMVIGTSPYRFIAETYGKPVVVSGFEPLDVLQSIYMVLQQIHEGRSEVENQYSRAVSEHGNRVALNAMERVFEPRDTCEWRGLGSIRHSGLQFRDVYSAFDAERKLDMAAPTKLGIEETDERRCGEVLTGKIKPWECPEFGVGCLPETPKGALMVSSEGACAAYYQYGNAAP